LIEADAQQLSKSPSKVLDAEKPSFSRENLKKSNSTIKLNEESKVPEDGSSPWKIKLKSTASKAKAEIEKETKIQAIVVNKPVATIERPIQESKPTKSMV
jgi:hypothetical protein